MLSKDWTLAFDTSAAHCAAALLSGDRLVAKTVVPMAKGQAESLFPIIQDLLAQNGIDFANLARIGVGIGPGNFTGIRISVSAARGLALSLGIPAVGVNNFEATAWGQDRPVSVQIPAPRDMAYVQTLHADGTTSNPIMAPAPQNTDLGLAPIDTLIENMAQIARSSQNTNAPVPMYVKPADAAPSRDAPVVHL